jgi:hypothetical protein
MVTPYRGPEWKKRQTRRQKYGKRTVTRQLVPAEIEANGLARLSGSQLTAFALGYLVGSGWFGSSRCCIAPRRANNEGSLFRALPNDWPSIQCASSAHAAKGPYLVARVVYFTYRGIVSRMNIACKKASLFTFQPPCFTTVRGPSDDNSSSPEPSSPAGASWMHMVNLAAPRTWSNT